eukprot:jgi/Pico_ML_1/56011/g1612.t1
MDASWRMDAVRRQLEELEAVRATWPEEGAVVLCREEEDALDQLRRTVDGGGALVVFGRRGDAATFVQNVKGLRWQAVAERYVEDDVDPARGVDVSHLPRGGWEEIDGERGFARLVERCRDAGLERVVHALIRKDT